MYTDIKYLVDASMEYYERRDIESLQMNLFHLYQNFNQPGGGQLIINYSEKDKLGECFCMCLMFDWMHDSDIREVWAEDGFYCAVEHLTNTLYDRQELLVSALNLFNILHYGRNDLITKFNDILTKGAILGNPIFSQRNYSEGAEYLIREFMFFAATLLSPLVRVHPEIMSPRVRPAFENAKTDFEFAVVPVEQIIAKLQFIACVIGSILEDM